MYIDSNYQNQLQAAVQENAGSSACAVQSAIPDWHAAAALPGCQAMAAGSSSSSSSYTQILHQLVDLISQLVQTIEALFGGIANAATTPDLRPSSAAPDAVLKDAGLQTANAASTPTAAANDNSQTSRVADLFRNRSMWETVKDGAGWLWDNAKSMWSGVTSLFR